MNIQQRLKQDFSTELPLAPSPVGNYKAVVASNHLLFISGQMPILNGEIVHTGQLGAELSIEQGQAAAKLSALNILTQAHNYVESTEQIIKNLVKLEGYINASTGFTEHAQVLNGASDFFAEVLGEQAGHIRTVIGCTSLPFNAAIEISAIFEIE